MTFIRNNKFFAKYLPMFLSVVLVMVTLFGWYVLENSKSVSATSAYVQSIARCHANDCSTNSTTAATASLTGVTAGNLIVVYVKWEGADTTVTVCDDGATCAAGHAFTQATASKINHSNGDLHGAFFYLLSSTAGDKTYTATFGASRSYTRIHVWEESYTGTATFNVANAAEGAANLSSGNITTTGTGSWVVFGAYGEYSNNGVTANLINGQAADQVETVFDSGFGESWREPFSATFTNGAATATGPNDAYIASVAAFNFASTDSSSAHVKIRGGGSATNSNVKIRGGSGGGGSVKFR